MTVTIREIHGSFRNHRIYLVDVSGRIINTTVTSTCSVVRRWLRTACYLYRHYYFRGHLAVGMGVQWSPFSGPNAPAATLQLCVGSHCLVFQLCHSNAVPVFLRRFLESDLCTFAGIWNHSDQKKLLLSEHKLSVKRLLDLRHCVQLEEEDMSLERESLETMASKCLGLEGVRLEGHISRSDWEVEDLIDEQVMQACVDAYVSFEIAKNLKVWRVPDSDLRY